MLNTSRLTTDTVTRRARWQATQNIDISWNDILDEVTLKCLQSCSLSTGTPIDFFTMPLLSTAASFMNEASVLVNEKIGWREPSIIWSVVSAPAGSRKSAAMKVFTKAIDNIYDDEHQLSSNSLLNNTLSPTSDRSILAPDTPPPANVVPLSKRPYMTNAIFTMTSLASKIHRHNGQYMLLYDEMSLLFKNIDKDAKDSPMRQVFLSLANGDKLTRTTATAGEEFLPSTNVNFCEPCPSTLDGTSSTMTDSANGPAITVMPIPSTLDGFIQPDVLFNQMQKGDPDGFLARMSIVTPRLVSFDYDDFTVLEDAVQVEEILRTVRTHHTTPKLTYTFSKEALVLFKEYYKEMKADTDCRDQFIEPEARSILNKMMGQSARYCMVMQAISNASNKTSGTTISKETTAQSIKLANYVVAHKLALITDTTLSTSPVKILTKEDLLTEKEKVAKILTQSEVTVRKISQDALGLKGGKRCVDSATLVLTSLASTGFGDVVHCARKKVGLKRKRYEDMSETARSLMHELEIDIDTYSSLVEKEPVLVPTAKKSKPV